MEKILSRELMVKPSECNANKQLPLTLLVSQLIDLATDHANNLGIGFIKLEAVGLGWVLSRLSLSMNRWPKNGESYILSTWIEQFNSHYSERCFSVADKEGNVYGYVRTVWMVIDLEKHLSVGTAKLTVNEEVILDLNCPVKRMQKHKSFIPTSITEYTFQYTDLDFYRHVNTVRYISILLNCFSLQDFDSHVISHFEIAFAHEARYKETATIKSIREKVENNPLNGGEESFKTIFEMSVGERQVLSSTLTLTQLG